MATDSTRVALANVLSVPCKLQLRVPIVAAKDVNDLVELNSQFETLNTLVVAFNGSDDPATLPYKSALGTLYLSSSLTSCGASVWHSFDKSLWIHKDSSNAWRVGAGLGCGTTYLLSDSAGGITPPVQNWSTPDGESLPSEDVLVVEATLWGSLAVHKLKQFQCQPTSLFVDDPVEEIEQSEPIDETSCITVAKKRWSSNVYEIEDDALQRQPAALPLPSTSVSRLVSPMKTPLMRRRSRTTSSLCTSSSVLLLTSQPTKTSGHTRSR